MSRVGIVGLCGMTIVSLVEEAVEGESNHDSHPERVVWAFPRTIVIQVVVVEGAAPRPDTHEGH